VQGDGEEGKETWYVQHPFPSLSLSAITPFSTFTTTYTSSMGFVSLFSDFSTP